MLSFVWLSCIILGGIMLYNTVIKSVILLNVVSPKEELKQYLPTHTKHIVSWTAALE